MEKKILYVEDHFSNMLLVKRIVQAEGHEFLTADDGEKGWQMVISEQPDLIFIDPRLPGDVDGFDLLLRIKEHSELKKIPAVALSTYGKGAVEERARRCGCDGFLNKPADIQQIRAVIRRYVGQRKVPPASARSNGWEKYGIRRRL